MLLEKWEMEPRRSSHRVSPSQLLSRIQNIQEKNLDALAWVVKVGYMLGFEQCRNKISIIYPDMSTKPLWINPLNEVSILMELMEDLISTIVSLTESLHQAVEVDINPEASEGSDDMEIL